MFAKTPLGVAAVVGLALAGCGGSDNGVVSSSKPGGGGSTLRLKADPTGRLRFDKKALAARSGPVTIVLSNPAPLSHNVSIEGPGVAKQGNTVGQGGTSKVSATLNPGTYTFYCSVPGHREAGMQGTLTVK
jgi:plastocyanin